MIPYLFESLISLSLNHQLQQIWYNQTLSQTNFLSER